jgi:hypothetical protein
MIPVIGSNRSLEPVATFQRGGAFITEDFGTFAIDALYSSLAIKNDDDDVRDFEIDIEGVTPVRHLLAFANAPSKIVAGRTTIAPDGRLDREYANA